jgi:chaperonin cofactor prefoldin
VVYHPPTSNDSDKKHQKAVEELQKQKEELERKLAVFKRQESILDTYSGTLKGADTAASKLNEFLDIYAARQSTIDEKKTELSDQITAINEDITQERKVWSADNEGKKRAVRITVVVVAEDDGPAEISVTYRKRPFYTYQYSDTHDFRLQSSPKHLGLRFMTFVHSSDETRPTYPYNIVRPSHKAPVKIGKRST